MINLPMQVNLENEFSLVHGCHICPRECGSPRTAEQPGVCGATGGFASFRVAKIMAHMWEEPFISGTNGAGTVFFSGCQLGCIFCQNHMISRASSNIGIDITPAELVDKLAELIALGVHNIELVSASHYIPQVIELISLLRKFGHNLPIIWNSSSYEKTVSLRALEGHVNIYMPDIKYADNELALKLSKASNYVETANRALREMIRQQPTAKYDENGIMLCGVVVRHLVLPGCHHDSMMVIDRLSDIVDPSTPLSLMSQYTPAKDLLKTSLADNKPLHRRLTTYEYNKVIDHAIMRGFKNILCQERSSAKSDYTPDFSSFFRT